MFTRALIWHQYLPAIAEATPLNRASQFICYLGLQLSSGSRIRSGPSHRAAILHARDSLHEFPTGSFYNRQLWSPIVLYESSSNSRRWNFECRHWSKLAAHYTSGSTRSCVRRTLRCWLYSSNRTWQRCQHVCRYYAHSSARAKGQVEANSRRRRNATYRVWHELRSELPGVQKVAASRQSISGEFNSLGNAEKNVKSESFVNNPSFSFSSILPGRSLDSRVYVLVGKS